MKYRVKTLGEITGQYDRIYNYLEAQDRYSAMSKLTDLYEAYFDRILAVINADEMQENNEAEWLASVFGEPVLTSEYRGQSVL